MNFSQVWDFVISIIWIFPNDFMPVIYDFLWSVVFAILYRIFGENILNFKDISFLFIDLAKFNACPVWTTVKVNKRKADTFDQFVRFLYFIAIGIFSFIYHILAAMIHAILCIFIITIPVCYYFCKIHFQLAFIELNPFKYEFETKIPFLESTQSQKSSRSSSAYSSARSSRESTPTPNRIKNKRKSGILPLK